MSYNDRLLLLFLLNSIDKDRPTLQKEILSMTTTIVIGQYQAQYV